MYILQVILQSDTIQELTTTSQALGSLQLEASDLRKLADARKNEIVISFHLIKLLLFSCAVNWIGG